MQSFKGASSLVEPLVEFHAELLVEPLVEPLTQFQPILY
jgi:hypothetical protein